MYEHYKCTIKEWQEYARFQLASMLKTDATMIGYSHAIIDGTVDVVICWELP